MPIQRPQPQPITSQNAIIDIPDFKSLKQVCEVLNFQLSGFVYQNSYNFDGYGNQFLPEIVFKEKDGFLATLASRYNKKRKVMDTAIIIYKKHPTKNSLSKTRLIIPLNDTNNLKITPEFFTTALKVFANKYRKSKNLNKELQKIIHFIYSWTPEDVINIGYDYQNELNNMKKALETGINYHEYIKEHNSLVE
jgi:hypothetical protein